MRDMNYEKIYERIVDRAKVRRLEGYYEVHHVIPRCMGGDNSKENLVDLTPEEHYLCHLLLVKMNPKNRRLAYAAVAMTMSNEHHVRSNKCYGWLRRKLSESLQKKVAHTCKRCGKETTMWPCLAKRTQYCSNKCKFEDSRVEKIELECTI